MDNEQSLTELETVQPESTETVEVENLENQQPEVQKEENESKSFTQEDLDAIVSKRLARERRKWEREEYERIAKIKTEQFINNKPSIDQYQSPEEYADDLALAKAEELLQIREHEKIQSQARDKFDEKEEIIRSKYDDYEQVVRNPNLPITEIMAQVMVESEIGPEIAYYLGTNVKDAVRIAKLSPYLQAKEIGKIEVRLSDNPVIKKTTSAPSPIKPVQAKGMDKATIDTTDPRSIDQMSTSEWIEAERQRQIKKLKSSIV